MHELYGSSQVRDAVVARWGDEVAPGGTVDRPAIARRVFADTAERQWLEGLRWPLVGARLAAWRTEIAALKTQPPAAVVETPLLFEAGLEGAYDATIAVVADEDLRSARAAARGHEAVDERSARQLTQAEKARRATYAVRNDGTVEELRSDLSVILEQLRQ